tara:strand:+ start:2214 stop:4049 length:1836 start_codon:yes stop_codon:yes gene_type:complete
MTIYTSPHEVRVAPLADLPVPTGEVISTYAADALAMSPFQSIGRARDLGEAQRTGGVISLEKQQAMYDEAGVDIKPKQMVTRAMAQQLIDSAMVRRHNSSVMQRATGWQTAGGFAASLGASVVDPINLVSAFIPIYGQAKYAGMLAKQASRVARAGTRFKVGLVEGAFGATITEPIVMSVAAQEQADYTAADFAVNMIFGGVLGGGLHMGVGSVADAVNLKAVKAKAQSDKSAIFDALSIEKKEQLFRANMALAMEDKHPQFQFGEAEAPTPPRFDPATFSPGDATTLPGVAPFSNGPTRFRASGAYKQGEVSGTNAVEMDGKPIPKDVEAVARQNDPRLWDAFDASEKDLTTYREWIDQLDETKGRPKSSETLRPLEEAVNVSRREIMGLEKDLGALELELEQMAKVDAGGRRVKKLERKITERQRQLELTNSKLEEDVIKYDAASKKTLESKDHRQVRADILKELETQDAMAVQLTASIRAAEKAAVGKVVPTPTQMSAPFTDLNRFEGVLELDYDATIRSQQPEGLRFYDQDALDDVNEGLLDPAKFDSIEQAEEMRAEAETNLKETYARLGMEEEDLTLEVDPDMAEALGQVEADKMMLACQMRSSS